VLATALTVVLTQPAGAAPGDLDPSFAGDGRVALPGAGAFVPRAVTIDAARRIVVAGYFCQPDGPDGDGTCLADGNASFRLARLTPDGGLDPEFGDNGFVTTPLGDGRSQALDTVIDAGGRIVAAGVARMGNRDVFAIARYLPDGSLDTDFGASGSTLIPAGAAYASLGDVALGPGGALFGAGQAVDSEGRPRMAVTRLSSAGAVDRAFGVDGVALGGSGAFGYGLALTVGADGRPLVAGIAGDSADPATFRFGELRLTEGGAPDPTFAGDGSAEQRAGSTSSFANALAPLAGGGFFAAGAATAPDGRQAMALERVDAAGTRTGAWLHPLLDGAVANDLVRDRSGRLLLVGQAARGSGYRFAVVRLLADSGRDPGFGDDGWATVGWNAYPIARATAAALQQPNRLVTVGLGCDGGTTSRCVGGTPVLLVARQLAGATRPSIVVASRVTRARLRAGLRVQVRLAERARLEAWLIGRRRGNGKRVTLAHVKATRARARFSWRLRPRRHTLARTRAGRLRLAVRAGATRATRTITLRR
jgi:uncharacterized delta-60 repeat protein